MGLKIFTDFHHQALYHSLLLLFEKRLGAQVYRSIGLEWYEQKYWSVYNHPATAAQYLALDQATNIPIGPSGPYEEHHLLNLEWKEDDGIYYIRDGAYNTWHRGIRLDKFKEIKFDIIIASIPAHIPMYKDLIQKYQPQAKLIFQIGNAWKPPTGVENILCSTRPFPTNKNVVFYHQEMDLDIFRYEPPKVHNIINSYVQIMQKPELLKEVARQMGWESTTYGAGMESNLHGQKKVAVAQRDSAFTWQYKPGGDGFGHSIYSSYACGRPALIWKNHYNACGANELFEDGVTCIDTSIRSPQDVAEELRKFSTPEEHTKMCEAAHNRFKQVVDYDAEFERINKFLEDLR